MPHITALQRRHLCNIFLKLPGMSFARALSQVCTGLIFTTYPSNDGMVLDLKFSV